MAKNGHVPRQPTAESRTHVNQREVTVEAVSRCGQEREDATSDGSSVVVGHHEEHNGSHHDHECVETVYHELL